MRKPLSGYFLGRRPYLPVLELMERCFFERRAGVIGDTVLLLEHDPVITLGRGAHPENILASAAALSKLGVEVISTGRGGDVTLHAPGQLIAYPILDLSPDRQDVRKYVQGLSRAMNRVIAPFGLEGGTLDGRIGLWIDQDSHSRWPGEERVKNPVKVGAIGVRISRWITQHGFALNVTTDLALFQTIIPCGIREFGVTSVEALTSQTPGLASLSKEALTALNLEFGCEESTWTDLSLASQEELLEKVLSPSQLS